jgi:DNA-binding HxlR family transcriptional regulator
MDAAVRLTGPLEPRDGWEASRCSVAAALGVVHNASAFLVLRELFYGAERFDEVARRAGLSEPTVAARLRELTADGLLVREDYREPGQRTRQKYRLTDKGADFFPILATLMAWGDRWVNDGGRVELRHRDCGEHVHVELRCAAGHAIDTPAELDLAIPGG